MNRDKYGPSEDARPTKYGGPGKEGGNGDAATKPPRNFLETHERCREKSQDEQDMGPETVQLKSAKGRPQIWPASVKVDNQEDGRERNEKTRYR